MKSALEIPLSVAISVTFAASVAGFVRILLISRTDIKRGNANRKSQRPSAATQNRDDLAAAIAQWVLTGLTAAWFAFRYDYTVKMAAPAQPWIGDIFTLLIISGGTLAFLFAANRGWCIIAVVIFVLSVAKDIEIILTAGAEPDLPNKLEQVRWAYTGHHHWYSAVRDLSLAAWWFVYWQIQRFTRTTRFKMICVFGVPYATLVLLWIVLKNVLADQESMIFGH